MLKAQGYIRYSTIMQGDNSVDRQKDAIMRWASRFGAEIVGWSSDLEVSRTTEHDSRPGLVEAIEVVKSGAAQVLVAESTSRFAGNNFLLGAIERALGKKGRIATANDSGNEEADSDRRELEALFSKFEIRQIRSRTKGALEMKRIRGERICTIPYGKRLKADGQHTLDKMKLPKCRGTECAGCLHLEDHPDELRAMSRARELSAQMGPFPIARQLNAEGFRGRTGNTLDHSQVKRMLKGAAA